MTVDDRVEINRELEEWENSLSGLLMGKNGKSHEIFEKKQGV